jgi:hypothetical protein
MNKTAQTQLALLWAIAVMANASFAALVQTDSHGLDENTPALPDNDLVLTGSDTLDSYWGIGTSGFGGWDEINDGVIDPAIQTSEIISPVDGAYVAYKLDIDANPAGYTISQISSYAGWSDIRINQAFEIKYALVGDTVTANAELGRSLGTFSYSPGSQGTPSYSRVSLTDDSGYLLTGVSAIEIKYLGGGNHAYTELAVVGVVPEPMTASLLAIFFPVILLIRRISR